MKPQKPPNTPTSSAPVPDLAEFLEKSGDVRKLVMKTFFDHLANLSEGLVVVDKDARVVWMNAAYPRLLGIDDVESVIGRPVEEVIPNSLLRSIVGSGQADMLDIMDFGDQTLAVMRIPFRDGAGNIIGAMDLLIAAHALANDSVLVTNNAREFSCVPGLAVEEWQLT